MQLVYFSHCYLAKEVDQPEYLWKLLSLLVVQELSSAHGFSRDPIANSPSTATSRQAMTETHMSQYSITSSPLLLVLKILHRLYTTHDAPDNFLIILSDIHLINLLPQTTVIINLAIPPPSSSATHNHFFSQPPFLLYTPFQYCPIHALSHVLSWHFASYS